MRCLVFCGNFVVIRTKSHVGILWEDCPCCFRSVLHRTWDVRNAAEFQPKISASAVNAFISSDSAKYQQVLRGLKG
mgnify:CR=1 FL=1